MPSERPRPITQPADEPHKRQLGNWGEVLLENVLHPLTVFGTPLFLAVLIVYFIVQSFGLGVNEGLRGVSGALLPLIISSFLFSFRKHLLEKLGSVNVIAAFVSSFVWGFIAMVLIRFLNSQTLPLALCEIVLSASFSVLVFGYVVLPPSKILAYYYGSVCGFLAYIIFLGLPILGGSRPT